MNIVESLDELNVITKTEVPYFSFENEIHLAHVVDCYDGDTATCIFKHNNKYTKHKVRLFGYDSPELKQSKLLSDEERQQNKLSAYAAKKRLEELILGKNVYLYCYNFDSFGRILADIKLNQDDKKTISQIMIDEGHGEIYSKNNL